MYLITALALITFAICVTILLTGYFSDSGNTVATGAVLLLFWLFACLFFNIGAEWQRSDTLDRYELIPKTQTRP